MSAYFSYYIDNQGERKPEFCAVIMHIGKEIRKVMDEKGVKPVWLAHQISTTRRNMYDMLKRPDLSVSVLAEISKKLEFNFFSLYKDQLPVVNESAEVYGKLKHENELLREQLELSNKLIHSKEKLLKEYRKKPTKPETV